MLLILNAVQLLEKCLLNQIEACTLSVNLNANKDLKEPSMEWIFQYAPSTRGVWWMENLDNSPKSLATILVEEKRNKKLPIGNWLALKSILQLGKKSV